MDKSKDEHRYDDIISLPHHVSSTRPHMTLLNRAAQFSPFAALTGYEDEVHECARLTDARINLDENAVSFLDEKLQILQMHLSEHPTVTFTYFLPDTQKSGGSYEVVTKSLKTIDSIDGKVIFLDKTSIPIQDIIEIRSNLFQEFEDYLP
jgi:hypothetical protein